MRSLAATLAGLVLALMATATTQARATECDRACLDTLLTRYLDAVVKHDPTAAPLAPGFRQTENARAVLVGKGVWASITGFGKLGRHYLDPVNGSAGFYGTLHEGGEGVIVTVRLQTAGRLITEAEWYISRIKDPLAAQPMPGIPNMMSIAGAEATPPPPPGSLPRHRRVPREQMVAAANAYFDSLQAGDETLMPAVPDWLRVEHGYGTGRKAAGARLDGPGTYPGKLNGEPTMSVGGPGACNPICHVAARRYPLVDEEAGVVLGLAVFQRPPGSPMARNNLSEWFTLDAGKITGIYAAMYFVPPWVGVPNWPPYDGNFPLPATPGAVPPALPTMPVAPPASGK